MTIKHDINTGDEVYFLQWASVERGEVTKVNRTTYKVKYQIYGLGEVERNIKKDRVAHVDDVCAVVCDFAKDPNGQSIRIDYEKYADKHQKVTKWHSPYTFISEG